MLAAINPWRIGTSAATTRSPTVPLRYVIALVSILVCGRSACLAQSPVNRRTVSRDQDLFRSLLKANRFDDAMMLCEWLSSRGDPRDDAAARWIVAKSEAMATEQLTRDVFGAREIELIREPVRQLLDAYPDHPRRMFLQAQGIRVERDAARHAVLRAAVSPDENELQQSASSQLVRAVRELQSLAEKIADERARLGSDRAPANRQLLADLERLEQELRVDVVSLALSQTELYVRGSRDGIAAAVNAERAATTALNNLPNRSIAKAEVNRLRIDAILRAGQSARANSEWERAFDQVLIAKTPRFLALRVRIDLALEQLAEANSQLSAFYGSDPKAAPASIEMDLARLEYLFQSKQDQGVGSWLDTMTERGGAYARRRAEVWSLNYLKQGSIANGTSADPSVVAARAKDWLRRGELSRAAELLSAAAASEPDASRAITRAIEAAAVWRKAGSPTKAAEVLSDIALSQPNGRGAAQAHLQAIVFASSETAPDVANRVESMLRRNLKQWPAGSTADGARRWLVQVLEAQSRHIEAAETATRIDPSDISEPLLDRVFKQWLAAFRITPEERIVELDAALHDAIQPLANVAAVPAIYRKLIALVGQRSALAKLPPVQDGEPPWVAKSATFRRTGSQQDLSDVPSEFRDVLIRRLMIDGRERPDRRETIARAIVPLVSESEPSLGRIERLLWQSQTSNAIETAQALVSAASESPDTMIRVSRLLGSNRDPKARKRAIEWWDQIAAGTTKGSKLWHEAKLASIQLLAAIGDTDQSRKRAKYVLLTNPDLDSALRVKYEAAAK